MEPNTVSVPSVPVVSLYPPAPPAPTVTVYGDTDTENVADVV
jgi:hypothetical protein